MNKKLLTLCVLLGLSLFCLLCGCSEKDNDPADRGYTMVITYDCNGGKIGKYEVKTLNYLPNTPILQPGSVQEFPEPDLSGFYVEGWYLPALDESGNTQKDEAGKVVLAERWDFKAAAPGSMTLYANWKKLCSITVIGGANGEDYVFENLHVNEPFTRPVTWVPAKDGFTFYDYYDGEGPDAQRVQWPVTPTEANPDVKVYVKWLTGEWNIVRTYEDLNRMAYGLNANYWLDADIDFLANGVKTEWKIGEASFTGKLEGNGHTVSNFTVSRKSNAAAFGLFNVIDGGSVKDVTFKSGDVLIDVLSLQSQVYVGWLAGNVRGNAEISGCVFTDCTLEVSRTLGGSDINIQINEEEWGGIISPINEQGFRFERDGQSVTVVRKYEEKGV